MSTCGFRSRTLAFACGILTCFLGGCGASGPVTFSGKVTYKGQAVTTGVVNLVGPKGETASAAIDEDGSFIMHDAPVGLVKVGIVSDKPAPAVSAWKPESGLPRPTPPPPSKWFPIDAKYADPEKSGIQFTLKSGTNKESIALE